MDSNTAALNQHEARQEAQDAIYAAKRKEIAEAFKRGAYDDDFADFIDPMAPIVMARIYASSETMAEFNARLAVEAQCACKDMDCADAFVDHLTNEALGWS